MPSKSSAKVGDGCTFGLIMPGSHYRFLTIDSQSHQQKGRSWIEICLKKIVLGNYLSAVPYELNMEKEMLEIFICD